MQKEKRKRRKLDDIINLIESEKNICCTHELFIAFDERCRTALKNNNYILIIDEAIECVQMFYQDSPADIKTLIEDGRLQIINDELKPTDQSYKDKNNSRYYCIQAAQERRLFVIDNKCYIWVYSPDIWQIFNKVYVLTYLFEGCTLKYYYDFYGIPYKKVSVILSNDRYQLIQHYEPSKSKFKNLVEIFEDKDPKLSFTTKHGALSSTFFRNHKTNENEISNLRKRSYNYVRNICNAKTDEILWTTFDPDKSRGRTAEQLLKSTLLTDSNFASINQRAVEKFADRHILVYLGNRFQNPEIKKFFANREIDGNKIAFNDDLFALSELIQWIWRSRIRRGQPIQIFIPSRRMRNLLKLWLNDLAISNN